MTTKDERIAAAASDMGFEDPQSMLELLEGQGLVVMVKDEPDDHDEALIDQLDEALCTFLHTGGEVGEHSPRTHLELFYEQQKAPLGSHAADLRCLRATQRALNDQRRLFIEQAAIQFATRPQFDDTYTSNGLVSRPFLLNPNDAVKEAVALWDAVQKALTE